MKKTDPILSASLFHDLSQPNVLAIADNLGRRIATIENLADGKDNIERRREMVAYLRLFTAAPNLVKMIHELLETSVADESCGQELFERGQRAREQASILVAFTAFPAQ